MAGPGGHDPDIFRPYGRLKVETSAERAVVAVKVVLLGELRRLAGRREADLLLPARSTVHTLARELGAVCEPAFAERVLTQDGDLQSHVAVFLNGAQLPETRDGATYLADGQVELMLVPMYEGG